MDVEGAPVFGGSAAVVGGFFLSKLITWVVMLCPVAYGSSDGTPPSAVALRHSSAGSHAGCLASVANATNVWCVTGSAAVRSSWQMAPSAVHASASSALEASTRIRRMGRPQSTNTVLARN